MNKASEKVEGFEEAIKLVKPDLDKIDAKLAANYLDAASTARLLIKAAKEKGASAYSLVGLLATLDDLSLDAEKAAVFEASMSALQHPPNAMSTAVLTAAATGCNDIAELIMHATLRYVYAEEEVLGGLLAKEK